MSKVREFLNEMTYEKADSIASDLVAKFQFLKEFPGLEAYGLSSSGKDKLVATFIIYAILATNDKRWYNSKWYGFILAMIEFGIVKESDIKIAILHYDNRYR